MIMKISYPSFISKCYQFTALLTLSFLMATCAVKPKGHFGEKAIPNAPDYADSSAWAALPWVRDFADLLPTDTMQDVQMSSEIDIFFLHPTIYTNGRQSGRNWNGGLQSQKLNHRVDITSIKFQASIFNGVGRVYAPRYRQAHLDAFFTKKRKQDAKLALDIAYEDVKAAFHYYLEHYNQGRPFIIAGHSQGAFHAKQLIKDEIENKPLLDQLVVAYLIGYPVAKDYYTTFEPCRTPEQIGCFTTWRSYKRSYALRKGKQDDVYCTNPISWTMNEQRVLKAQHKGAILRKFDQPLPNICDAQVHRGFLAMKKPKFPGSAFMLIRNYHIGDMNFFYFDIRQNARLRSLWYYAKGK
jgi:hypothetical protein